MTFELPQPGEQPPKPPPVDLRSVHRVDWVLLGLGVLTFVFSLLGFYKYEYSESVSSSIGIRIHYSRTWSAWVDLAGGGFIAWFGVMLSVVATVLLGLALFSSQTQLPWPPRYLVLLGFAASFCCELLATFLHPRFFDVQRGPVHEALGHDYAFWTVLILPLAATVLALMRAQQTNTKLPAPLANIPRIGR